MVLTTTQLRQEYAPPCDGASVTISLHGAGKIVVAAITANAFIALNQCLMKWDYKTRKADTGAYNCRKITGGSGWSLHAYKIAADLNWQSNPYGPRLVTDMPRGMIDDILAIRTNSGARVFGWGGYYKGNKDAMHFEVVCSKADLRSGINKATVPGGKAQPQEDDLANVTDEEKKRLFDAIERIDRRIDGLVNEGAFKYAVGLGDMNWILVSDSGALAQLIWYGGWKVEVLLESGVKKQRPAIIREAAGIIGRIDVFVELEEGGIFCVTFDPAVGRWNSAMVSG